MIFFPARQRGLSLHLLAGVLCLGVSLALGSWLFLATTPSLLTLVALCGCLLSVGGAGWAAYRIWALLRARYVVSPNALVVEWGERRIVWPITSITEVRVLANPADTPYPPRAFWLGYQVGWLQHPALGTVECLAAEAQSLVAITGPTHTLVLSPGNVPAFLAAFAQSQAVGPTAEVAPESAPFIMQRWSLWQDAWALVLVLAGGLGVLALLGYILALLPQLPAQIPLHFNALQEPDRIGPPSGLLILPLIAGAAWLVNTLAGALLHRLATERVGAYLLFAASLVVQVFVWVAALSVLSALPT